MIFVAMLSSALLHAAWNVELRRDADPPAAGVWLFVGGAVAIAAGAIADVALHGHGDLGAAVGWGLVAGISEACYLLSLARAVGIGPLSTVYAVSRGAPLLLLWPLSHLLLGEPAGATAAVAVGLLLAGLAVLAPARRTTTPAGYAWACATALFNVTNALLYKGAISGGAPVLVVSAVSLLVASPVAAATLGRHRGERLASALLRHPVRLAFAAGALAGSFLLSNFALRTSGAAWVTTIRNSSIAFAPLLAWGALGERPSKRSLAGVVLVFAGALALGLL